MPRKSKLEVWFKHYTDKNNPKTFLNGTGSAKEAGYRAKTEISFSVIGSQNLKKLKGRMSEWLDDVGLSDESLKTKLLQLSQAKETKFIKIKGFISNEDLPEHVTAIGTSGIVEETKDGDKKFSAGDTLVAVETDALSIQTKNLEMALKVKGLFSPEEINLNTNLKGIKIEFVDSDKNE